MMRGGLGAARRRDHRFPCCWWQIVALVGLAASPFAVRSQELQLLTVDLDGSGIAEQVRLSTLDADVDGRKRLRVEVRDERYETEYFSLDGDLPHVRVVAIDDERPERQLLIATPEPASCVFRLLSFTAGRLFELLQHDAGPSCMAPLAQGNGIVAVATWVGFWSRVEIYRLASDGRSLKLEVQDRYPVNVAGFAASELTLEGAGCEARKLPAGSFLMVKGFEPKGDRYLLESADGACGWVPANEADNPGNERLTLPWAG